MKISSLISFFLFWANDGYCRRGDDSYYNNSNPFYGIFGILLIIFIVVILPKWLNDIFNSNNKKQKKPSNIQKKNNTLPEIVDSIQIEKPKEVRKEKRFITFYNEKTSEHMGLGTFEVAVLADRTLGREFWCESIHKFNNYYSALGFCLQLEPPHRHAAVMVVREGDYDINRHKKVSVLLWYNYLNDINFHHIFPKISRFVKYQDEKYCTDDDSLAEIPVFNH